MAPFTFPVSWIDKVSLTSTKIVSESLSHSIASLGSTMGTFANASSSMFFTVFDIALLKRIMLLKNSLQIKLLHNREPSNSRNQINTIHLT